MEKNTQGLVVLLTVIGLLVGFALGGVLLGGTEVKEVEKVVVEYEPVLVEVEVPVLVEKDFKDYKNEAVSLCLANFTDSKILNKYQTIEILKVSDGWEVLFDGNLTVTVDWVRYVRYDELENKAYAPSSWNQECEVFYEEGEEPVITA